MQNRYSSNQILRAYVQECRGADKAKKAALSKYTASLLNCSEKELQKSAKPYDTYAVLKKKISAITSKTSHRPVSQNPFPFSASPAAVLRLPYAAPQLPFGCAQRLKLTSQNQTYLKSPLFVRYSFISLFSSFLSYQIYQETQPKTSSCKSPKYMHSIKITRAFQTILLFS